LKVLDQVAPDTPNEKTTSIKSYYKNFHPIDALLFGCAEEEPATQSARYPEICAQRDAEGGGFPFVEPRQGQPRH